MKDNKLELVSGRKINLLLNMNALINYSETTGKDLESLEMKTTDIRAFRDLGWAMAAEGEAAEGRELGMTLEEFGREVTPGMIVRIVEIMRPQLEGKKKVQMETKGSELKKGYKRDQEKLKMMDAAQRPPRAGSPMKIFFRRRSRD